MKKTFPELPAWSFDMDEVSAGVYEVVGSDNRGNRVSAKGTDLDTAVEDCRQQALKIAASR